MWFYFNLWPHLFYRWDFARMQKSEHSSSFLETVQLTTKIIVIQRARQMAHIHTYGYTLLQTHSHVLCAIRMVYAVIVFNTDHIYKRTNKCLSHPSWTNWNIHWNASIRDPRAFHHDLGSFAPSFSFACSHAHFLCLSRSLSLSFDFFSFRNEHFFPLYFPVSSSSNNKKREPNV